MRNGLNLLELAEQYGCAGEEAGIVGSAGQAISMAQDLRTLLQTAKAEAKRTRGAACTQTMRLFRENSSGRFPMQVGGKYLPHRLP